MRYCPRQTCSDGALKFVLFTKPKTAVGIDIGTHSVKAVQMSRKSGRLCVDAAGYALVDRNQVNADPVAASANALREAVRKILVAQCYVVGALPGQAVVIRYPRLPDMEEDKIGQSIESDYAGQNIPYDLSEVFLDWVLLDTVVEGDEALLKILLVAAKHETIEGRTQIAEAADIQYAVLGVDSVATADAAECCDFLRVGETVAMVNLGLTSTSIHFIKDGISNFIRDVNWGSREMIQAIAKASRVDYEESERMLYALGSSESEEEEEDADLPEDDFSPTSSAQDPSLPSSPLDPFEDELGGMPQRGRGAKKPARSSTADLNEILEQSVSRLVLETRRSFDFFEHQLYEGAVDRLILSGGIAHLPLLSEILQDELDIESIEVADPTESALILGPERDIEPLLDHPAQFMVAVGLAARGMSDL